MRQCGNAVMLEARPCVAGLRRNTRSDCRRAATHGAPSYITALPHSQIAALPHYRIAALPNCHIAHGTGSCPLPPHGWQLATRFAVSQSPLMTPCLRKASMPYCEQVGVYLHLGPSQGEITIW